MRNIVCDRVCLDMVSISGLGSYDESVLPGW